MGGGTGASGVGGKLQLLSDDFSDAVLVQLLDRCEPVVRHIQLRVSYNLNYDLEWCKSGKDLDCKTECRARVTLSMTLYVCMLGALPSELSSNILFCHGGRYGLCVRQLTSSFSERSRCYFWTHIRAKCLERNQNDGGVV